MKLTITPMTASFLLLCVLHRPEVRHQSFPTFSRTRSGSLTLRLPRVASLVTQFWIVHRLSLFAKPKNVLGTLAGSGQYVPAASNARQTTASQNVDLARSPDLRCGHPVRSGLLFSAAGDHKLCVRRGLQFAYIEQFQTGSVRPSMGCLALGHTSTTAILRCGCAGARPGA